MLHASGVMALTSQLTMKVDIKDAHSIFSEVLVARQYIQCGSALSSVCVSIVLQSYKVYQT